MTIDQQPYKTEFLQLARELNALRFGEFTLKSGRVSPYFFNAGLLASGKAMAVLGDAYAAAIVDSGIEFDCLFGPAYKGIPVAAVTAAALYQQHGRDLPWAYNRKEKKDHGEGGTLVGAELAGQRVLVIDDVVTAGTAIRESITMIREAGGEPVGVAVALDRQERGQGELSAIQELEQQEGLKAAHIVGLSDLIQFLQHSGDVEPALLEQMQGYRDSYGV